MIEDNGKRHINLSTLLGILSPALVSLLTLIFVVLKLFRVINWSWWWVISPVILVAALAILLVISVFIGAFICEGVGDEK